MKKGQLKDSESEKGNQPSDNLTAGDKSEGMNSENSADNLPFEVNENSDDKSENEGIQFDKELQEEVKSEKLDYDSIILEWKEKYLRLSAEFDNYRKRTLKERIDLTKYAGEETLKDLLPVVDDFERGLKNLEQAKDINAIKEGIELIYSKFKTFLTAKGLKEIDTTDGNFNTDYHEAITKIPVDDKTKSGKIIDVVQKGYMLNEKVVRFSKVVIGE
jgi:molecular chaperone GrpE